MKFGLQIPRLLTGLGGSVSVLAGLAVLVSPESPGLVPIVPPEHQSEPSWSPDGSRIAFRGGSFPDVDIWVAGSDGSNAVQLTDDPAADDYPVWSPRGDRLAFISNRAGPFQLHVMAADGSRVRSLVTTSEQESDPARPAWTPDGEEIVVRLRKADGTTELAAIPASGGEVRRIEAPAGADWPDVHTDGTVVVSAPDEDGVPQIWVLPPDAAAPRQITSGPGRKSLPRFSSDGTGVLYVVNDAGTPNGWEIARTDLNDFETRRLTDDDHWKFYPEPAPNGRSIVFTRIREGMMGPAKLWLIDADGSNPRPLFR